MPCIQMRYYWLLEHTGVIESGEKVGIPIVRFAPFDAAPAFHAGINSSELKMVSSSLSSQNGEIPWCTVATTRVASRYLQKRLFDRQVHLSEVMHTMYFIPSVLPGT